MMAYVANRMMDLEVESLTGMQHGGALSRTPKPSQWLPPARLGTRAGTV
jgi:hypothetical protein